MLVSRCVPAHRRCKSVWLFALAVWLAAAGCPRTGDGAAQEPDAALPLPDAAMVADASVADAAPGLDAGTDCTRVACADGLLCLRGADGGVCRAPCTAEGGCASNQVCQALAGDAGGGVCIPGGGLGAACAPEPCLPPWVCARAVDSGAACRYPCAGPDDDGGPECPEGWTCFSLADASAGACFPR